MEPTALLPAAYWPYTEMLTRLALGLALGLLIGLERERRGKEAGLRTFGFICVLGTLGGAMGDNFALAGLGLTGLLAILVNLATLRAGQGIELTTSFAMLVTVLIGVLCGRGHTVTPAAVAVVMTALLTWKDRMVHFSTGLTEREIRSALLLAILAIVIYPALPKGTVGPGNLIEPRAAWITVILIAGIGFINYILWKIYGTRGTELSGFFGGLINSNFTVIELVTRVRQVGETFTGPAWRGIMLATTAMLARNAILLLLLAPLALAGVLSAFALMLLASALMVAWNYYHQRRHVPDEPLPELHLESPFSLKHAVKYGLIFLLLHVLGALTQRQFGDLGFYFVSAVGGLMSSASAVAAAAALAQQGSLPYPVAGTGAVLASFTSMVFSLSFVLRGGSMGLLRRLFAAMAVIAVAGAIGMALSYVVDPWLMPVLTRMVGLPS